MPEKPTQSGKPAWASLAVLIALSVVFGLFILPRFRASSSRLAGVPAPLFALPVLDAENSGNRLALRDLRGKAVILDFWASWCRPCREQMPIVERIAERFRDRGLVVVGVNTSDEEADARNFVQSRSMSYASVFDLAREASAAYGVQVLPTLVIIDRQGRIVDVRTSIVGEGELEDLAQKALDQK
jgi:thiol-disulfide isomerase/thioredoxin